MFALHDLRMKPATPYAYTVFKLNAIGFHMGILRSQWVYDNKTFNPYYWGLWSHVHLLMSKSFMDWLLHHPHYPPNILHIKIIPIFPRSLGHWPQPWVISILSNSLESNSQKKPCVKTVRNFQMRSFAYYSQNHLTFDMTRSWGQ